MLLFARESLSMAGPPGGVVITSADAGRTVSLVAGQRLSVKLEAQPGTGYGWEPDSTSTPLLSLVSTVESDASMPGAVQTQTLTFVARSAGEGALNLVYRRPWEKDGKPAKSFSVLVKIGAQ